MKHFNSKEYAWVDLQVFMFGRLVTGIRGTEYKKKKAKGLLHAAGKRARGIQHGKREVDGTFTLLQSEVIALNKAARDAGYDDILDVDFDVVVCYLPDTGVITTDRIVQASITEMPKSMKESDLFMEVPLPFIAIDVEEDI